MAYIRAISTNTNIGVNSTLINNDGGSVLHAGNVPAARRLDVLALGLPDYVRSEAVVAGTNVQKALTAGTLAYQPDRSFVMMKVSETLSGVANTVLLTGSSWPGYRRKAPNLTNVRTTFLSGLTWSNSTDLPTYTFTKVDRNQVFWGISQNGTSFVADDSVTAVTNGKFLGELTYRDGSFLPINDEYATQQ